MQLFLFVSIWLVLGASPINTTAKYQSPYSERIVGGLPATIEQFPWIVSIQYQGTHRCGASIISPNRILTAAHCTHDVRATTLSIRAGSTYYDKGGQLIDVIAVKNHPKFNPKTYENDVSVIWLASWINTTPPSVAVVPMAAKSVPVKPTTYAKIAGWGYMKEGANENSPNLRWVEVPIVEQKQCKDSYGGDIKNGMICAGFPNGGYDACQNDSGGPLTVTGVLVGVVSWGKGCARPKLPGIYASVSYYRAWIDSNM